MKTIKRLPREDERRSPRFNPFSALAVLALLSLVAGAGLAAELTSRGDPPGLRIPPAVRSLRQGRETLLSQAAKPPYRYRKSHVGWEVRTEVFVVDCRTTREDAQWVTGQLEQTWARMGKLADHFTDLHRQAGYGRSGISVYVDDRPQDKRAASRPMLRAPSYATTLYINVASGSPSLKEQLPRINESTVHAFFNVGGFNATLPPWVRYGMARYVALDGKIEETKRAPASLPLPGTLPVETDARRIARTGSEMKAEDIQLAAAWFGYLMRGDDAAYVYETFDALRKTDQQRRRSLRLSADARHPQVGRPPYGAPVKGPTALDDMIRNASLQRKIGIWMNDHQAGQPLIEQVAQDDPKLAAVQREMALVLKLARRFELKPGHMIKPRAVGSGPDGMTDHSPKPLPPESGLRSLYNQLTSQRAGKWATLDADGSFLLSTDRRRLAELLDLNGEAYQPFWKKEGLVLRYRLDDKTVVEGRLEANPDDPRRPLAKFKTGTLR